MDELKQIRDVVTESLVVGSLYKSPQLLDQYEDLINPEADFTNEDLKFLFNLIRQLYHAGYKRIDETTLHIELSKSPEKEERFKKINKDGYKTIRVLTEKVVNTEDFPKHYKELKKYNMLRELYQRKFPIIEHIDKLKKLEPDEIYNYFDHSLNEVFSHYAGVGDSVILGKDILKVYENWKVNPDTGIEIFYYIINRLLRGWRLRKLNSTGFHSGKGKSRFISLISMYIGIILQIPILVIVNEQEKDEWDAMLLCAVVNNIFVKKYNMKPIEEEKILTGQCVGKEDEICTEAAQYISERSKIYFQETQIYDFKTLQRVLKTHKLKGVNFFIYDTFKPFRGDSAGASWEAFVKTSEDLKKLCGSKKKGGLDMGGWITFQLTDESQFDSILTSSSVASGKQIKHNLDSMIMGRPLSYSEKERVQVKIMQKGNLLNGELMDLSLNDEYYILFVDKNRGGKDQSKIIYRVDKGKMIFEELGFAHFKQKEDEEKMVNRKKK